MRKLYRIVTKLMAKLPSLSSMPLKRPRDNRNLTGLQNKKGKKRSNYSINDKPRKKRRARRSRANLKKNRSSSKKRNSCSRKSSRKLTSFSPTSNKWKLI